MESEKEPKEKIKTTSFLVIIVSFVSHLEKEGNCFFVVSEAGKGVHVCACARAVPVCALWLSDLSSQFVSSCFTALADLWHFEAWQSQSVNPCSHSSQPDQQDRMLGVEEQYPSLCSYQIV